MRRTNIQTVKYRGKRLHWRRRRRRRRRRSGD